MNIVWHKSKATFSCIYLKHHARPWIDWYVLLIRWRLLIPLMFWVTGFHIHGISGGRRVTYQSITYTCYIISIFFALISNTVVQKRHSKLYKGCRPCTILSKDQLYGYALNAWFSQACLILFSMPQINPHLEWMPLPQLFF